MQGSQHLPGAHKHRSVVLTEIFRCRIPRNAPREFLRYMEIATQQYTIKSVTPYYSCRSEEKNNKTSGLFSPHCARFARAAYQENTVVPSMRSIIVSEWSKLKIGAYMVLSRVKTVTCWFVLTIKFKAGAKSHANECKPIQRDIRKLSKPTKEFCSSIWQR